MNLAVPVPVGVAVSVGLLGVDLAVGAVAVVADRAERRNLRACARVADVALVTAPQDGGDREHEDLDVQPERPVVDVGVVPFDRVEWDNYYVDNWSLWLDVKILVLTVAAVLRGGDESDIRNPGARSEVSTFGPVSDNGNGANGKVDPQQSNGNGNANGNGNGQVHSAKPASPARDAAEG